MTCSINHQLEVCVSKSSSAMTPVCAVGLLVLDLEVSSLLFLVLDLQVSSSVTASNQPVIIRSHGWNLFILGVYFSPLLGVLEGCVLCKPMQHSSPMLSGLMACRNVIPTVKGRYFSIWRMQSSGLSTPSPWNSCILVRQVQPLPSHDMPTAVPIGC